MKPVPILTTAGLAHVLQSARKEARTSQAELGGRVGLRQGRVSALERDPGALRVDQLLAICASLGLELSIASKASAQDADVAW